MRTQSSDLDYGEQREIANKPILENWLEIKLRKLDKYNVMDWVEEGSEVPWYIEQKARKLSYDFVKKNYSYNNKATAMIGKHKIDYMKLHGNGIVVFDFTDRLMYWVFDEAEYATFDIEKQFVRYARSDYVDKPSDVVHIPLDILKDIPR